MRQTLRLGRIAGIPVGMHWSVLVIALLLAQGLAVAVLPAGTPGRPTAQYWTVAVAAALVFLGSLLAHELSHALVARHYGVRVRRVTLWLLGGVAELDGEAPHARADLLIALAGPVTSLASGALFGAAATLAVAAGLSPLAVAALAWLAVVNVVLAVFNMLPGAPLDGGRILRAILWRIRGDRAAAQRVATRAGVVLGLLLSAAGALEVVLTGNLGGLWLVLLGWFLISAASSEGVDAGVHAAMKDITVGDVMTAGPVCGYADQTVVEFVAAVARHTPYRTFPVLDLDGRPVGMVSLARLGRVPGGRRGSIRLRDVVVPLARTAVLAPDVPLAQAAPTVLGRPGRLVPVIDAGHVIGVLSSGDVSRAIELAHLGAPPHRAGQLARLLP